MRIWLLALGLATGFSVPAMAQTGPAAPESPPGAPVPTRNAPSATEGVFLKEMPPGLVRLSKTTVPVIGSDIFRLGKIEDALVDSNGTVTAIVIRSGLPEIDEKLVAVPFREMMWDFDVWPTDPPSSSNTGGLPAPGGLQAQSATAPRPNTPPPETTGTVGNPAVPNEGLKPENATTLVTGNGAPWRAFLRITKDEFRNAPEFRPLR